MDPRDLLRPLPDGAACTACGATVPAGRIRILARRDDVAFVELACHECGSDAIGLLITSSSIDGAPLLDVADEPDARTATDGPMDRPISTADVETVRADLAGWTGNLVDWLARLDGDHGPGGRHAPGGHHGPDDAR